MGRSKTANISRHETRDLDCGYDAQVDWGALRTGRERRGGERLTLRRDGSDLKP